MNLKESINKHVNKNNIWKNSVFEDLTNESNDARGKWGEDCLQKLIKNVTDFSVEWDGDSNTANECGSIFDILVNTKRTEVKTAMVGYNKKAEKASNTWQHENIYEENVWDKLLLFDIAPDGFYITTIDFNDMCFGDDRHPVLKKKSTRHLSAWKFDTSKAVLERGLDNGYTIYIEVNENGDFDKKGLKEYFEKHFV